MICPRCANQNPPDAGSCSQCGQAFGPIVAPPSSLIAEQALWRQFIGPRADYYLEKFRAFQDGGRFVPTWHWPPLLCAGDAWLWYLYRKMYLHAVVFLFGGILPLLLGAGVVGMVIWNVFAAVAANYLYYMHVKLSLAKIAHRAGSDTALRDRLIADAGGIQPYVWWLGFGILVLKIAAVIGIIEAPAPAPPPTDSQPA